jgi:hypothetical protein
MVEDFQCLGAFFLKEEAKWRQVFLQTFLPNGETMDGDMVQG